MILWVTWAQLGGSSAPRDIGGAVVFGAQLGRHAQDSTLTWLAVSAGCQLGNVLVPMRKLGPRGGARTGPREHTEFITKRTWTLNSDHLCLGSTRYQLVSDLGQVTLPLSASVSSSVKWQLGITKAPAPTLES